MKSHVDHTHTTKKNNQLTIGNFLMMLLIIEMADCRPDVTSYSN